MEMLNDWNPALSSYVRELSISLYKGHPTIVAADEQFEEVLPITLANTMNAMSKASTKLEVLKFEVEVKQIELFRAAFASCGLTCPHVQSLVVGSCSDFMVDHCPHITTLAGTRSMWSWMNLTYRENDYASRLLKKAAGLANLECFALGTLWDHGSLEALGKLQVQTLLISGGLDASFERLTEPILLLPAVEVLSIPAAFVHREARRELGDQGSDGEDPGRKARRDLQYRKAQERVAGFIFDHYPGLKELWFGTYINVRRTKDNEDDGSSGLVWSREDEVQRPLWAAWV
ncbi:hypothetical protein BDW22DRAFT_1350246 [Trametopsis cervina]|nr:hypothetical protein BDW22DRAFT_1350246 [Trametopsis cervina]